MTFNSTGITHDHVLADTPDGQPVAIDFKTLVGKHILIAARTGSGKSVAARKILELALAAGMQVFVFDSDGTLASLRDTAPNGILVAGGEHGDPGVSIPGVLKRLTRLFTMRASVVLDISTVDVTEQNIIIARFLDAMMKLPPDLHQPCLIMIDEVQNFAPERGRTRASAAIVRVAKQGRRKGLSLQVATQRLPDVSRGLTSQMAIQLSYMRCVMARREPCDPEKPDIPARKCFPKVASARKNGWLLPLHRRPLCAAKSVAIRPY